MYCGAGNRECVGYYSINCASIQPKYSFNQRTTLSLGRVDLSLLWRYIHKVKFEPQQHEDDRTAAQTANDDQIAANIRRAAETPPRAPLALPCPDFDGEDPGGCVVDPRFRKIDAYHYFDFSTRFNVNENFDMTVTAVNIFDKKPPVVGGTVGNTAFNGGNT